MTKKPSPLALVLLVASAALLLGCSASPVPTTVPIPKASLAPTLLPTQPAVATPTLEPTQAPTVAPTARVTVIATGAPTSKATATRTSAASAATMKVKIFMVALEDNGKSGKKIGCGDSIVAVERTIPTTSAVLTAAMKELVAVRDQYYGMSGLYNSLYRSNLKVVGVSIANRVATIQLSGSVALGGTCDNPRFAAQIQETALQFSTVSQVAVYVNGTPMERILSEK